MKLTGDAWRRLSGRKSAQTKPLSQDKVRKLIEETSQPKEDFGSHFDFLVEVINDELSAQLAIGAFGDRPKPDPHLVLAAAAMIADEVDEVFRLELKHPERPLPEPTTEQRASLTEIRTHVRRFTGPAR